jgi:hypothetical protein
MSRILHDPPVGFEPAIPASERPQTKIIYVEAYLSVEPISFKTGKVERYRAFTGPQHVGEGRELPTKRRANVT